MKFEQDNIARLFKMAIFYGEKIGHKPQFLIEPKPKEPSKHQYDFDVNYYGIYFKIRVRKGF